MNAILLAIGLGAGAAAIAAVCASAGREWAGRSSRGMAEPEPKRLQQRARDYIASGALPRWDP